jgi:Ca2+-binding EF-hand superfamily protein
LKLFKKYDKLNKGYFDFKDLKRVSKELNEELTDE